MTLNASQLAGMRFCCNKLAFSSLTDLAPAFLMTLQGQEVACVLEKCHLLKATPTYQRVFQLADGGERSLVMANAPGAGRG